MNEKINVSIIKQYIKANGLTKKEFCKQCGISTSTLNRILNNKEVMLSSLFRIAKTMNVPFPQLFTPTTL